MNTAAALHAATSRKLRPSEAAALAAYIATLESKVASLISEHESALRADHVICRLEGGNLQLTFPGQHTVSTAGLTMDTFMGILRSRLTPDTHTVGKPSAPTAHELELLARASGVKPRKIPSIRPSAEEVAAIIATIEL